tara:strand:- start:425 stop:766 length:342 start_codon:yes stop_codon:yes gene_type:complete
MAIKISGTSVINDQARVATGMQSIHDRVFSVGVSTTLQNLDYCSVTIAGLTITLPPTPTSGNQVTVKVGNFSNTVVGRNSSNIMGLSENMTINVVNSAVDLIFVDSTRGWEIT